MALIPERIGGEGERGDTGGKSTARDDEKRSKEERGGVGDDGTVSITFLVIQHTTITFQLSY